MGQQFILWSSGHRLEKLSFHSNLKEGNKYKRMFNYHASSLQLRPRSSYSQNPLLQAHGVHELRTSRCKLVWRHRGVRDQMPKIHLLWEKAGVPEKKMFIYASLTMLNLWSCGSQKLWKILRWLWWNLHAPLKTFIMVKKPIVRTRQVENELAQN